MFYTKQKHNTVFYRNYNEFDSKNLRTKLQNELIKLDINFIEFQNFHNILLSVLNENTPLTYLRANNTSFITKDM